MASIGLKVNHDQYGTNTGQILAKAMLTDPSDAIAIEKMKSALITDEMQRRLLREQASLVTQQTIDRAMLNKREHAAWLARYAAADEASALERDLRYPPAANAAPSTAAASPAAQAATTPPPVVVEPDFEYRVNQYPMRADTAPATGPAFDYRVNPYPSRAEVPSEPPFEYRVNQYPMRADDDAAPVPVELPPMPAPLQGVPPGLMSDADITSRVPAMPPRINGLSPDLVGVPTMQPPLQGVPPGLVAEPPALPPGASVATPDQFITFSDVVSSLFPSAAAAGTEAPAPVSAEPGVLDVLGSALGFGGAEDQGMVSGPGSLRGPVQGPMQPPPAGAAGPVNPLDLPVPVEPGPYAPVLPERPDSALVTTPEDLLRALPQPDTSALAGVPVELRAPDVIDVPGRPLPIEPLPAEVITAPGRPIDTPIEALPAKTIKVPGREVPAPAATAADATAAATATGSGQPATTPAPASAGTPQEGTGTGSTAVVGVDGGAQDTATTIQTASGPVPRDYVSATMKYIFLNASSPAEAVQAAQRWAGTIGATYNPQFGTDPRQTENIASLRQGGGAISKEALVAQTGQPAATGYAGTAIEAQDHNTLVDMGGIMASEQAPTPDQARSYAQAWGRQFGTPKMQRVQADDGAFYDVPVPVYIPPGTPTPEEVYARAGIAGTTPAPATPPATTATPAAEAPADTQATPATTAPAPATAAEAPPTANGVPLPAGSAKVKGAHEVPPAEQLQNERYLNATTTADADIKAMSDADIPTPGEELLTNPTKYGANWALEIANVVTRSNNPKLARYWGNAMDFATAILRDESGAATRPEDMETVLERYIPRSTDSPAVRAKKAQRREIAIAGLRSGAFPGTNPAERLDASDKLLKEKLGEGALLNEETNAAEKATEKKPRRVKMVDGKLVDVE